MSDAPLTTPKTTVERALDVDAQGARGFLVWLRASMPGLYRSIESDLLRLNSGAMATNRATLGAFGEAGSTDVPATSAPASSSWTDSVSKLIQAYGQYKLTNVQLDTLKKITDVNLQRAQQGMGPLPYDASQLGLAPTVNVGLSSSTGSLVKYALIGGALLLGAKMLLGHSRARA